MGLPPDDPLRFDSDGQLLSKEALDTLLDGIIESWPTWDWSSVSTSPPERRASLSGESEEPRRREWLSR
jgi:hypothetical protein